MTETTTPIPIDEPRSDESSGPPTAAATPSEAAGAPAPEAAAPPDPAETLAKETAELKDRLLRTLADMENLRRRSEREVADARLYGIANFARDMLGVADNMRRALDAIGAEMREAADDKTKALIEGVDLTERELLKAMEKHGVKRFEPQGERFDPNFHQAMFELPDPNAVPGTVVQVMQAGYRLGERVLRPALVAVAKVPPKPAAEAPANENTQPG
jgi:molecular chaperone GrpE